jgi:hypothetical protein
MFDSGSPLFVRLLSLFHVWLPALLLWLVPRLGYDPRAFWVWTGLGTILLLVSYFLLPAPPAPAATPALPVNVNLVYGFSDAAPQPWMPPLAYLGLLIIAMPLLCYLPVHLLLRRFARRACGLAGDPGEATRESRAHPEQAGPKERRIVRVTAGGLVVGGLAALAAFLIARVIR